jgi:two-component system, cell cycle response regulator
MWSLLPKPNANLRGVRVTEPSDISARLTELEIYLRRGKTAEAGSKLMELSSELRRHLVGFEALERINQRLSEENRQLQEGVKRLKGSLESAAQEYESTLVTFERFRQGIAMLQQMRSLEELPEMLGRIRDLLALATASLLLDGDEYSDFLPVGFAAVAGMELERLDAELFKGSRVWLGPVGNMPCAAAFGLPATMSEGSAFACSLRNKYQPERIVGILVFLDANPERYSKDKATDFLLHFCDILGWSIVAVKEHEKLDRDRVIDPLTGAWNREYLSRHAPRILEFSSRRRFPVTALFIDMDRFKSVNDTFGHEAGDRLLREVATRVRAMIRQYDIFVRLGGDEFVLILPDTGTDEGSGIARRISETIAAIRLSGARDPIAVSASIGIASYVPGERLEDLLAAADRDMYRHKRRLGPTGRP